MDRDYNTEPEVSNAELVNRDTFERLMAKKKFKKIVRRINYTLLTVLLCLIFIVICMAVFLKIETIEIKGNERYDSADILASSGIEVGQNLYAINKKTAEAFIIRDHPYVNDVVIRRTLPSTLTFKLTEDEPVFYTEICDEFYILSQDLRVLERVYVLPEMTDKRLIPIVMSEIGSAIVGEYMTFEKSLAFDYISGFVKAVSEHDIADRITEIDVTKRYNIYVNYEDRFRIYLGDNTETNMKLTFAKLMIDTFSEGQSGEIDAHDITVGSVILDN
jgi:cell division protein FtsQ